MISLFKEKKRKQFRSLSIPITVSALSELLDWNQSNGDGGDFSASVKELTAVERWFSTWNENLFYQWLHEFSGHYAENFKRKHLLLEYFKGLYQVLTLYSLP